MKNGENALETHSGQWMRLNRNTRTVLVESGTPAALETSMLYTERYL